MKPGPAGRRPSLAPHADAAPLTSRCSSLALQVRNIAGLLLEVGLGRLAACAIPDILAVRDRSKLPRVPCAPADGLHLAEIVYEQDIEEERVRAHDTA